MRNIVCGLSKQSTAKHFYSWIAATDTSTNPYILHIKLLECHGTYTLRHLTIAEKTINPHTLKRP